MILFLLNGSSNDPTSGYFWDVWARSPAIFVICNEAFATLGTLRGRNFHRRAWGRIWAIGSADGSTLQQSWPWNLPDL